MTPYQAHVEKWKNCTRCSLHTGRCKVVFCKGPVCCDVLFVGEAPGDAENVTGDPFEGPAGIKLDGIIQSARYEADIGNGGDEDPTTIRMGFYNLVSCFPAEAKKSGNHAPPVEAIKACLPKLREFVEISKPSLIVTVGKLSDQWTPKATEGILRDPKTKAVQWASIVHPAAILRAPYAQQSLMVKQSVIRLAQAFKNL